MVSIVIPVYNVEKYLDECIESVLQLKSKFEVILVDDGSKDRSGEICDEWACNDERIRVIHQENGGLSAARNTGILASKGEYIMFLDSDDFLDPIEADNMLRAQSFKADIIVGLYNEYYTNENLFVKEKSEALLRRNGVLEIEEFLELIPKDGRSCYMLAQRFVVKRTTLLEKNLLFYKGIYHEDEEWTHRLFSNVSNVFVSNHFFYQYRQAREGSIMSKVEMKHIRSRFIIMEHAEKLLQEPNISNEKKEYLRNRVAQLYLSNMIDWRLLDQKDKKETCKMLKKFQNRCSRHLSGSIGKTVQIFENVFGVTLTCYCMAVVHKVMKGN